MLFHCGGQRRRQSHNIKHWCNTLICLLIADLRDILIDQMLSGKQYKRAVRGLTLVYEAMIRCLIMSFLSCVNRKRILSVENFGCTECEKKGRAKFSSLRSVKRLMRIGIIQVTLTHCNQHDKPAF